MRPFVSILYPESSRSTVEIPPNGLIVGRGIYCGLRLDDEYVSSEHCKISYDGMRVWVQDLKSSNGTYISGELIDGKKILGAEQDLQVGQTILKVRLPDNLTDFPLHNKKDDETTLTSLREIALTEIKGICSTAKTLDDFIQKLSNRKFQHNGKQITITITVS